MEKDVTGMKAAKVPSDVSNRTGLNDGSAFREAFQSNMTYMPSIRQDIPAVNADKAVNIDRMIDKWTLNIEQSRAFRIIAEHSLEKKGRPLCMFLGGQGRTGKLRVINALRAYFHEHNQKRRFRLAS
ncbi:hypothetical protein ARMGADRAFT_1089010 [Armillaria gallica]|uniref:Uncharacterized protein n=1 Tax=Armillaria gallica TaxID=47427 RepID=A0A2H3D400_ARMGA|nr:hypothetical protein ARMGADRAFT_1089010 [Armillaria gallica]